MAQQKLSHLQNVGGVLISHIHVRVHVYEKSMKNVYCFTTDNSSKNTGVQFLNKNSNFQTKFEFKVL